MIVFDLACSHDHIFEAWFGSTDDFEAQAARGLVACPICEDSQVRKAAMAPAVPAKGNRKAPVDAKAALAALAHMQAEIEASLVEAAALVEDGIDIAPLPFATRRARDS